MKKVLTARHSYTSLCILFSTFLLSIGGCEKENTAVNKGTASVSSSEANAAIVTDQHFDFPGPYSLTNHCTGENVTALGTIGDDIHIVINGSNINLSEHQQGQLTGTGTLGNSYLTNINENVTFNGSSSNGLFVIEDITIFRMISTNGSQNFTVRRNAHLTVDANGVVTVNRIDFTTSCP